MTLGSIIRYIKWQFAKKFYSKQAYDWWKVKLRNSDLKNELIIPLTQYTTNTKNTKDHKRVICMHDGKLKTGGLVDRLRGIISVYSICKEYNIDFKILFTQPFPLDRYLIPNSVEWRISQNELHYNIKETDICLIESINGSKYEAQKQDEWFRNELKKSYCEFHIYTNAHFSYNRDFAKLFAELFKPSPLLQQLIDKEKKHLGENYISTSFRFLDLLNDFNETAGGNIILSKTEQSQLINKNIEQLNKLHNKYPQRNILVNSDSSTFLQEAAKLDFTYIIPGEISHVDSNATIKENTHDKTFTDFFMIANAKDIFLFITGDMYNSGFPFAAAQLYNKPFHIIRF